MDERRLDPRDIAFDICHGLNYDPCDPVCDLMFDPNNMDPEICLTNPVDARISQSDHSLPSCSASAPDFTKNNLKKSSVKNCELPCSLRASSSDSNVNGYRTKGCQDKFGNCVCNKQSERKLLTSQNQNNGSLNSSNKDDMTPSMDKLQYQVNNGAKDNFEDRLNKDKLKSDISKPQKTHCDTDYIKCSNSRVSIRGANYLSTVSQNQSCDNKDTSVSFETGSVRDKHKHFDCNCCQGSSKDSSDSEKGKIFHCICQQICDKNCETSCQSFHGKTRTKTDDDDCEVVCQSCYGKTRASTEPIPYRTNEDPMLDLTYHSFPDINYAVMGVTGAITGVNSELLLVREDSVMVGHRPLDTVSLPPEVGELKSRGADWYQTLETNTAVCNGGLSVSQSGAIRRTYSEPDVTGHRRIRAYGLSRPSRQAWYRRTAHSHRGSIISSSYRRFPSTTNPPAFSLWKTTRQEKALLFCFCLCNLCAMMCMSVMAPFFPGEAEEKGVNLMLSGWIFGVFALTEFFFAPICGKLVSVVDPEFMFLAGQFFSGSCYILFGLLEYVESTPGNNTVYLVLAFTLRVFTAIGCSASATATFTITAVTFPDNIATVFGLIETSTGLGMSLGPALGGVLYDAGGFQLPFISLGAFMVIMVPVSKCMLPGRIQAEPCEPTSVLRLLRVPAIDVTCVCVFLSAVVWSTLDPTLQPHLTLVSGYNLTSTLVGLVFLLMSACYGIFCPIFGIVCDHVEDTSPMLVLGFILSGVGTMLLGPSPHLGFPQGYNVLWLNLVALIVLGFALSLATVPTFDKILDAADKAGFKDNIEMYGVVAGLWGSCYAFGDFVGPSLGGFLSEHYSFPWCMTYIGYTCWAVAVMCSLLWLYERSWGPTQVCGCCGREKKRKDKMAKIKESEKEAATDTEDESRPLLRPNGVETSNGVMPSNGVVTYGNDE